MFTVIKSNGEKELFDETKVRRSIHRVGIPDEMQNQVVEHVKSRLYENMPTSQIFRHILDALDYHHQPVAKIRFSLKRAVMELGPTGYPFEDFVAQLLQSQGYSTQVRQTLKGKCVTHEIDVVAQKDEKKIIVEAKFHNLPGNRTNIHVALYTKARFDDIKEMNAIDQAWIVTNTNVTTDAVAYADCVGLTVIGWERPDGGLQVLLEKTGFIPITALPSLPIAVKQQMLLKGIIFSKQLCEQPQLLNSYQFPEDKKNHILEEATCLLPQRG